MNGILLVPHEWMGSEWASQSWCTAALGFRGSRYLIQGYIIVSHNIPWDAITYPCLKYLLLVPKSWYSFIPLVSPWMFFFSINRDIFPQEWRDHADKSLGPGNAHYTVRWSHDRPNFIMETVIQVRPVFILVHHRVYSANAQTGIRTSITKLEQSWDRLNFIMGIPIKPTLYICAIPENCYR